VVKLDKRITKAFPISVDDPREKESLKTKKDCCGINFFWDAMMPKYCYTLFIFIMIKFLGLDLKSIGISGTIILELIRSL
jgi:hypothetical protein